MTTTDERNTAGISTFVVGGVLCSTESLVVTESSLISSNIRGEKSPHRKSAKPFEYQTEAELGKAKVPIVKIDKRLERFRGRVLFPEKLALANKMLANATLPKIPVSK